MSRSLATPAFFALSLLLLAAPAICLEFEISGDRLIEKIKELLEEIKIIKQEVAKYNTTKKKPTKSRKKQHVKSRNNIFTHKD